MARGHRQLLGRSWVEADRLRQLQLLAHKGQIEAGVSRARIQRHLGDFGDGRDPGAGGLNRREVAHLLGDGLWQGQRHPKAALAGIAQGVAMVGAEQELELHGGRSSCPQW